VIGRVRERANRALGESQLSRAIAAERRREWREPPRSIFVLRNNDLGDVLVATPLFAALRARFPEARVLAGVGAWAAPLLVENPDVSEVVDVSAPWFNKYTRNGAMDARRFLRRSPAIDRLRAEECDVGIDPLGSVWGALLLVEVRVARRLGTLGYAGGERAFDAGVEFDPRESVALRCARFAGLLAPGPDPATRPRLYLSDSERAEAGNRWRGLAPAGAQRVLVAPGAGLPAKAWPIERFESLVAQLSRRLGVGLAVVGGPKEVELCRRVAGTRAATFVGELDVRQTCALVATADCVLCNSSFVLHAAAASGTPALALLGPAFASAEDHQRQWGCEGLTRTLGPERKDGRGIASVAEVLREFDRLESDRVQGSRP
jgi:heptosyltransferase-2